MTALAIHEGAIGFDTNQRLTATTATAFYEHGYEFALRYVPRIVQHENDITIEEKGIIRAAGLGLMVVQHCEDGAWRPTADKGSAYGATAARHCVEIGYAPGASVWLDLEEVAHGTAAEEVIGYCNSWFDVVALAGFLPGVYVGWNCRLTPDQLYRRLKFRAYWGGYNLDRDQYPAVRGLQMKQREPRGPDVPLGVGVVIDVDVVSGDALGGFPVMDR